MGVLKLRFIPHNFLYFVLLYNKIGSLDSPFCVYCLNPLEKIENFVMLCPKCYYVRDILKTDLQKLNISVNSFSISDLLSGAGFPPHIRRLIMKVFCKFVESLDNMSSL